MFTAEALRARRREFENKNSVSLRWIMPFFLGWDSAALGLMNAKGDVR
jgi:hypothetical protein